MVRGRQDKLWTLPGGWIDVGESPSTAVTKEILEETGYLTKPLKLVACFDRNLWGERPYLQHVYKLFFHCQIISGAPQTSLETDKIVFFAPDELPSNLSTARVTRSQIHILFRHCHNPDTRTTISPSCWHRTRCAKKLGTLNPDRGHRQHAQPNQRRRMARTDSLAQPVARAIKKYAFTGEHPADDQL
jgi:ADP-ribose pyrophosphatase YjhB (NUDIX family)